MIFDGVTVTIVVSGGSVVVVVSGIGRYAFDGPQNEEESVLVSVIAVVSVIVL